MKRLLLFIFSLLPIMISATKVIDSPDGLDLIKIHVAFEKREEAVRIVSYLLEKQLIIGANIFPVQSFWRYDGEIVTDDEVVLIATTTADLWEIAAQEIERLHSYDRPCILGMNVSRTTKSYPSFVEDAITR